MLILNLINKYKLSITVFFSGAIVMILELIGSRMLAPYVGTSLYVWSSLIGIILGALSIGYWLGGKLSDKYPSYILLSNIIFAAAIYIALLPIIQDKLLQFISSIITVTLINAVVSVLLLFTIPSILLGIISPFSAKLKMHTMTTIGQTIGNLYALATIGSIFGTFLAGFLLISFFGHKQLLIIISIVLFGIALINSRKHFLLKLIILLMILLLFYFENYFLINKNNVSIDIDTQYNRVLIYNAPQTNTLKTARAMIIGRGAQSAMYLNSDELAFTYLKYFNLADHFKKDKKNVLVLGGAGYSYPKYLLATFPEVTVDVVEIDPKLTELAYEYFQLKDNSRLNIIHEDARVFLNRNSKKYDVIYVDVAQEYTAPFQLTTYEAVSQMSHSLTDDGVILQNIISGINGKKGKFLRAEYHTYRTIFPEVFIFPTNSMNDTKTQNIILVALKARTKPILSSENTELNNYLQRRWEDTISADLPILTDNFAPVDQYLLQAFR